MGNGAAQRSLSFAGQEIVEALHDDIVFGRLNPRERLVEAELVARFQTHRAAVREALSALESSGLIERPRNKGASVRDLRPEHLEQIYAVRILLEVAAVRAIPLPMAAETLVVMEAIQREHEAAVEARDFRRIFEQNKRFHNTLYGQSGNSVLVEMIEQMATRVLTVRFRPYHDREFLQRVLDDHWAIIEACRRSDREALILLVSEHLPLAKTHYLDIYRQMADAAVLPLLAGRQERP